MRCLAQEKEGRRCVSNSLTWCVRVAKPQAPCARLATLSFLRIIPGSCPQILDQKQRLRVVRVCPDTTTTEATKHKPTHALRHNVPASVSLSCAIRRDRPPAKTGLCPHSSPVGSAPHLDGRKEQPNPSFARLPATRSMATRPQMRE